MLFVVFFVLIPVQVVGVDIKGGLFLGLGFFLVEEGVLLRLRERVLGRQDDALGLGFFGGELLHHRPLFGGDEDVAGDRALMVGDDPRDAHEVDEA